MIRSIIIVVGLLSALVLPTLVASAVEGSGAVTVTFTVALGISDVSAANITQTSANISWKTNGDATSQVFYDTVYHDNITDYAHQTIESPSLVSAHTVTLSGLSQATTYHYRVRSALTVDSTQFVAISEDYTFTTSAGCFIATAAYGTPTAVQINILRQFRDKVLLPNKVGAAFVSFYYRVSPPIAEFISRHELVRTIVREGFIDPLVAIVRYSQIWWDK